MEVMQSGGAAGLKPGMRVAVKRFTNKTLRAAGLAVTLLCCDATLCFCGWMLATKQGHPAEPVPLSICVGVDRA